LCSWNVRSMKDVPILLLHLSLRGIRRRRATKQSIDSINPICEIATSPTKSRGLAMMGLGVILWVADLFAWAVRGRRIIYLENIVCAAHVHMCPLFRWVLIRRRRIVTQRQVSTLSQGHNAALQHQDPAKQQHRRDRMDPTLLENLLSPRAGIPSHFGGIGGC